MVSQVDQQRVCALLTEAVTVICKNGLTFNNKFCIEGLLGITLDDRNMFLVNIKESITKGTSGGNTTNQNKSQSGSKAGVFVGMPNVQSNGGRGAGPMPMQRPTRGMSPAMMQQQQQQQLQRRRPGGPQPQVIPAKRPVPAMGPNPNMGRGRGGGPIPGPGQGGSMPQEWAALIQLQQQQPPGMLPSTRGRSRGTARRGGMNRMQHRTMAGIPGEVKSPPRRMSQSGIELESREEVERKAAEQARLRSERLERRRSGGPHDTIPGTPGKPIEGASDGEYPEKPQETTPPPKTEPPREDANNSGPSSSAPDKEPSEMDTKETREAESTDDTENPKEEPTPKAKYEMTEDTADEPTPSKTPTPTKAPTSKHQDPTTGSSSSKGGAAEGQPEGPDGTKQEGDGSWLLSNSSWLLGDLESMASNTAWKDSAQSDKSQDTAKGKPDDGDP